MGGFSKQMQVDDCVRIKPSALPCSGLDKARWNSMGKVLSVKDTAKVLFDKVEVEVDRKELDVMKVIRWATKEGSRVRRGPDWAYGDQDGGDGGMGTVVGIDARGVVKVRWDHDTSEKAYRVGFQGSFELCQVPAEVATTDGDLEAEDVLEALARCGVVVKWHPELRELFVATFSLIEELQPIREPVAEDAGKDAKEGVEYGFGSAPVSAEEQEELRKFLEPHPKTCIEELENVLCKFIQDAKSPALQEVLKAKGGSVEDLERLRGSEGDDADAGRPFGKEDADRVVHGKNCFVCTFGELRQDEWLLDVLLGSWDGHAETLEQRMRTSTAKATLPGLRTEEEEKRCADGFDLLKLLEGKLRLVAGGPAATVAIADGVADADEEGEEDSPSPCDGSDDGGAAATASQALASVAKEGDPAGPRELSRAIKDTTDKLRKRQAEYKKFHEKDVLSCVAAAERFAERATACAKQREEARARLEEMENRHLRAMEERATKEEAYATEFKKLIAIIVPALRRLGEVSLEDQANRFEGVRAERDMREARTEAGVVMTQLEEQRDLLANVAQKHRHSAIFREDFARFMDGAFEAFHAMAASTADRLHKSSQEDIQKYQALQAELEDDLDRRQRVFLQGRQLLERQFMECQESLELLTSTFGDIEAEEARKKGIWDRLSKVNDALKKIHETRQKIGWSQRCLRKAGALNMLADDPARAGAAGGAPLVDTAQWRTQLFGHMSISQSGAATPSACSVYCPSEIDLPIRDLRPGARALPPPTFSSRSYASNPVLQELPAAQLDEQAVLKAQMAQMAQAMALQQRQMEQMSRLLAGFAERPGQQANVPDISLSSLSNQAGPGDFGHFADDASDTVWVSITAAGQGEQS